ncbi:MAG: class I SAM-dependent RNA methyltransferase [Pseudomonadota bacterium]
MVVDHLGARGDGVADGPVYIDGALPGETVSGVIREGRMTAARILTPSPERVRPPCRHAKSCGGCLLQHASDAFVAGWKVSQVQTALARVGVEATLRPVITSPPESRRRATLAGRRTKSGALLGFYARASDTIVDVPDCQLLAPALSAARPALTEMVLAGGTRKGTLTLQVTESDTGLDVAVSGGKPLDLALLETLSAVIRETPALARLTWNEEPVAQNAVPALSMGRAPVPLTAGGFLQATRAGEAALLAGVEEAVGPQGPLVDLFAGSGTFTLPLSETSEVHAVEAEPEALEALSAGWRAAGGLHRVTVEPRDLFRNPLQPSELKPFAAAVIDPPRAGAAAQVAEIAESTLTRLALVSCNPATFARDTRRLVDAGFGLDWVQVVDQFRWSPHIEIVSQLSRR